MLKNKTLTSMYHFPIPSVKTGYWSIPFFSKTGYWSIPYFSETGYWSIPSFSQLLFIFQSNTMLIAWIWLEGIGKFPPHPSAKKIWIPHSRLRRSWEIHFFCLGIWREFSNTFSPYPSHCISTLLLRVFWAFYWPCNYLCKIFGH